MKDLSARWMQGALWWLEDSSQQILGLWLSRNNCNTTCRSWTAEMLFAIRGRIWMKSQIAKFSITLRLQVYIAHPDVGFLLLFSSITLDG
ncbi:Ankyrin Repeat Domain-Containing Protein 42 [Manis pentadactyla]|nr:Ankyrin Repeat Domain-Containing Protein 42 [Manis pentadactyla]